MASAEASFDPESKTGSPEEDSEVTSKTDQETKPTISDDEGATAPTKLGSKDWDLTKEDYHIQLQIWPTKGKHILAHYDDESIVVYQAFKSSITQYAVQYQRFGGPDYKFTRMSWIKTNFLWMMFRCGWARKHNQEHVLAIRITRDGFERILSKAFTVNSRPDQSERINNKVRLQWDPDHMPNGEHERRRAIQLGLRGQILEDFGTKFILNIKDITDFVHEQHSRWQKGGNKVLVTPRERVYVPTNTQIHPQLELDFLPVQTVVSVKS